MKPVRCISQVLTLSLLGLGNASAQDFTELRANIDLFSGVLEEALDVGEKTGLFGMSLGGVESTYIQGQGVVIEVRTPLANRRNRLSLASLNSTMQSLQSSDLSLDAMRRSTASASQSAALAFNESAQAAEGFYQQMMDRIANVDYRLAVDRAIQQASDSMRSLRSLGDLNDADYEQLRSELDSLRARMQATFSELRELEQTAQAEAGTEAGSNATLQSELSLQLDALLARIEPLREQALAKARELQARTEQAEQRHNQQWQSDVEAFESRLYSAVCDYGASLRDLPERESVAVILQNLGDDAPDNSPMDKVHVIPLVEIQACQRGAIDAPTLRQRSTAYSY